MKHLSLQWRITLMSVLLIGVTCISMNLLLCSSGMYYMDTIANTFQGDTVLIDGEGEVSFDPQLIAPDEDLTIIVDGAQGRFRTTNWYITAAVRERVSKVSAPQVSSTSCCVNCRRVRLRIRASSSAR